MGAVVSVWVRASGCVGFVCLIVMCLGLVGVLWVRAAFVVCLG